MDSMKQLVGTARFLIDHGADINSKSDSKGNTPLFSLLTNPNLPIFKLLALTRLFISKGFDVQRSRDSQGIGILHLICRRFKAADSHDEGDVQVPQ
jgi:ankyrin repeat protein